MIPKPVVALIAQLFAQYYTASKYHNMLAQTGTSVESPGGSNKVDELTNWLTAIGRDDPNALGVLGELLEHFFETMRAGYYDEGVEKDRDRLREIMGKYGLRYMGGAKVLSASITPVAKTLETLLKEKGFPGVDQEFQRATANVETEPREAASAAANILEAICKEYIVQHPHLTMPPKQELSKVFDVVRKDLGFDPSAIEDDDLRAVLSGLIAVVSGLAAFRTHASSAHAQSTSKRRYRLKPRHARLAVHSAHAIVAFILETWEQRERGGGPD